MPNSSLGVQFLTKQSKYSFLFENPTLSSVKLHQSDIAQHTPSPIEFIMVFWGYGPNTNVQINAHWSILVHHHFQYFVHTVYLMYLHQDLLKEIGTHTPFQNEHFLE